MHRTTQLNTPSSHTRGTPESRRCSWSNPLPRECSRSCVFSMVVCRQPLHYRVAPSSKHRPPQPRPNPLVSCIAIPWSYPTPLMLASTENKHRGSLTHYSTHRAPANRSRPIFLFALFIYFFPIILTPFP